MANDNPFLQGMAGGLQLAVATKGAGLQLQEQMLRSTLELQQMQRQDARQERQFQQQQAAAVVAERRDQLQHTETMARLAAERQIREAEAPLRLANLNLEYGQKILAMQDVQRQQEAADLKLQSDSVMGMVKAATYGLPPVEARQRAADMIGQFAQQAKGDPRKERIAQMSLTQFVEMDRANAEAATKDALNLTKELSTFASSSGDPDATTAAKQLFASAIESRGAAAGIDLSGVARTLKGATPKTAAELAAEGKVAVLPSSPSPRPVTAQELAVKRSTVDSPATFAQIDKRLAAEEQAITNPVRAAAAANARRRLAAVQAGTDSGLLGKAASGRFGEIVGRGLSERELTEMSALTDPEDVLRFLEGVTDTPEPAPVPYYPRTGY